MRAGYEADQSQSLFTDHGERKYLSAEERRRFYAALDVLDEISRTFCELIFWTGARPGEVLALKADNINVESAYVVIRSLKKRCERKGKHYRIVPLPRRFVQRLAKVHQLQRLQRDPATCEARLWPFSRTTGWKRMAHVMKAAGIAGVKACARGLRHSFGVNAALNHVPETRIQKWLGHAKLTTTAIYLDIAALEDREIARRMWIEYTSQQTGSRDLPYPRPPMPQANSVSQAELLRLLSVYTAISNDGPRRDALRHVEASVGHNKPEVRL